MAKYLTAFLVCLYVTGHLSYQWGAHRGEAKSNVASLKRHESTLPLETSDERLVRLSVVELEKRHARGGTGPQTPLSDAGKVAALARHFEQFPTEVLESAPETVVKTAPLRVVKVACRGLPGSPDERFTAYFPLEFTPNADLARHLAKGMRLRLKTVPDGVTRHSSAIDFRDGRPQNCHWVSTFEHDETLLKRMSHKEREVFARLSPGEVLKSSGVVRTNDNAVPLYFYGGDWSLYRPDAEERVLRDEHGSPRHSILRFDRLLKERGVQLFFVPVPQSASLFPDAALGASDGMTLNRTPGNVAVARLLEVLQEAGVHIVDLTQHLISHRYVTTNGVAHPISRTNDSHWSPAGAMLAAQRIAECVAESGALAGRAQLPPDDFEVREEVQPWPGDLNFLPTLKYPGMQLPPSPIPLFIVVPKVRGKDEMLDQTCPSAEVHLIGDSNSTAYIDSHAGLHAHLVRSLGTRINVVAMDGSATLGSPNWWLKHFGNGPVKVVIWAVAERFLAENIAWSDFSETSP